MKINNPSFIRILLQLLIFLFFLQACFFTPLSVQFNAGHHIIKQKNQIGEASQIIWVKDEGIAFFKKTKLYLIEKTGDDWIIEGQPYDAVIGRNGFALTGQKREGDGKTPSGIYPLKMTFGYHDTVMTKMPYRQALSDDVWIDDVHAEDYNRWTKKTYTLANSYEMMKREDNLYQYGIIIEYNTDPVVKGNGSAIFLHIWPSKGIPTAGCVAVSEENMIKILQWLDPAKSPIIILGTNINGGF